MKPTGILAFLLGSFITSHGYVLDSSCSQYSQMVITGMQGAFDLAQAGSDTFGTLTPSGSGVTWQAQRDLVSYLFAQALTNGNINTGNEFWRNASRRFNSVLNYNNNNGQPEPSPSNYKTLSTNAVIVFCDFTRFKENQDCYGVPSPGRTCDTTLDISWPISDAYTNCKNNPVFGHKATEAWAWDFASENQNKASEIQLCPWYLKEVQEGQIQSLNGQGTKNSLAKGWKKLKNWMDDPLRTPMDVASTFDATLLHEMTHAVPKDSTNDFGGKGYGWKNCNKLSSNGGTYNADSYAFFGIGSRMISPNNGEKAQRPMSDGSIQLLNAAGGLKRDLHHAHHYVPRGALAVHSNITLTVDHTNVTLNASNSTGFIVSPLSMSPVTVATGRDYTVGTDVISLESSAIVYDHSTMFFPVVSPSATKASVSNTSTSSFNKTSINGPSTFSTSTRAQNSSRILSLGTGSGSSSTSSNESSSGSSSNSVRLSTDTIKPPLTTGPRSSLSSLLYNSLSNRADSSGGPNRTEESLTAGSGSFSSLSSGSGITPVLVTTNGRNITSTPSSSGSFSDLPLSLKSLTGSLSGFTSSGLPSGSPSSGSTMSKPVINTIETITSGSSALAVPITVISVSKSGITSPVTYISTYTSSSGTKPTGAWMCTGPLCNIGSSCIIPLFCASEGGSSGSWGLCCGWDPPAPAGGSPPAAGGPSPGPPDSSNKPTGSGSGSGSGSVSQSISSTGVRSSSSSSSCSTQTTSACDTSYSVFTPTGASTASTLTITGKCSTITACSGLLSGSETTTTSSCSTGITSACDTSYSVFTPSGASTASTSTITLSCSTVSACSASLTGSSMTGNQKLTATLVGDDFLAWDTFAPSWYDMQQTILREAMADTTDPYTVWSSNEDYVSYNPSLSGSPNGSSLVSAIATSLGSQTVSPSDTQLSSAPATVSKASMVSASITSPLSVTSTLAPPITSCTVTNEPATMIDGESYPSTIYCACNDGWQAGIGSTVGSDRATTYTCEAGRPTMIAVSTAPPTSTIPSTTVVQAPTSTTPTPIPSESCKTAYRAFYDTFNIWGFDWDASKLDAGGDPGSGNGLHTQLSGCAKVTDWGFTDYPSGPWQFWATGKITIWQKTCIEHAMLSAGAPVDLCSGSG